ncbi:MAG: S-layer protein [Paenibacillus sp.]|nr:S-layer protein [Paenibacillus sp.]
MKRVFKQVVITGMALAMVVGGATSAFADGKGRGNDNDRGGKNDNNSKKDNDYKIANNGTMNIAIHFHDMVGGDVEWAIKNIASLASKRVFEGYADGSFKPRNNITRVEAITAAVRLMGLRDQAESQEEMSTKLNFKDADKIPSWAVGYVAVALENDLFNETENSVQPDKPADRLWATTLLVKALKLESEAKAKMNTQLSFKDANEIPAGSVGYVAVAVEKGLIEGFENNTFRPNTPVTRAQLAALLDRTGEQMPGYDKDTVTGTVSTIVNSNVINITKNGVSTPIVLDPGAFVFKNGARVTAADIKVGDELKVKLYNNIGIFVEITKSGTTNPGATNFTVDGKIYSITYSGGKINTIGVTQTVYGSTTPQLNVYSVSPDYTITGNAALLIQNQDVQLKGINSVVTSIEVK